jgi:2'-5' RNA ligase
VRLFVAVPCPEPVAAAVAAWQAELRGALRGFSWVAPRNFHLTLRFLGEVAEERIDDVREAVRDAVAGRPSFQVELVGAGAFPRADRPRVVWVGARSEGGSLPELAAAVDTAVEAGGFGRADRPFAAHLTIGRARQTGPAADAARLIGARADTPWGAWRAEGVVLLRSELRPEGARYTPVEWYNLA